MWFYFDRILVAHQVAEALAHDRPRGNLSDLYPRWLGARELLLHGRNPYAADVTQEIQRGYYGRALDSRRNDPRDEQGFAYPVYVVFLLAPSVGLPFRHVQLGFYWMLLGISASSVWLWLRGLVWQLSPSSIAAAVLFMLGTVPVVQGIKLQQLSLLVAVLLAAVAACAVFGYLFFAGSLLALATIKPQLTWLLAAWLLVWVFSNWRERRNLLFGFGSVMLLLLGGSEILLPGWLGLFMEAMASYHRYTQNQSVLDQLLPWAFAGKIVAGIAIAGCAWLFWQVRDKPADSAEFGITTTLVLALTVLVMPMYAPYNQVLLLPAVLVLVRDREFFLSRSRGPRFAFIAGFFALAWPWIASATLSAIYLLGSPALALSGWKWPFFSTFIIPVLIFSLMFLRAQGQTGSFAPALGDKRPAKNST
jgi:hypothetical protein